jgi:hypothetical protein
LLILAELLFLNPIFKTFSKNLQKIMHLSFQKPRDQTRGLKVTSHKQLVRWMHMQSLWGELTWLLRLQIFFNKFLRKSIVRGVLTNGHKWIFLILKVKEDCNGGEYLCSKEMSIISLEGISRKVSSLIAAIITHWVGFWLYITLLLQIAQYFCTLQIPHSYEELRNDDYFMVWTYSFQRCLFSVFNIAAICHI